jgi:enterochelin esterase-like enzyme
LVANLGDISIVSGWFPVALFWVTLAAVVVSVVWRHDWKWEFAIGIPLGIVFIVVLFVALHLFEPIPAGAPHSMYLWLGAACLVGGLVIAGWHMAHVWRRILGVLAVILAVVSAGSAANVTFAYYPTLSRLLGKEANHFLDDAALKALREQVQRTGILPHHGATLEVAIPGLVSHVNAPDAYVWVPPDWFARDNPQLPVIELLHGTPGSPSDWTRAGFADATSLAFAERNHGVAPILVMPAINGSETGDSECADSKLYGNMETYLTVDVLAYMAKSFNADVKAGSVAVAGLSEGGTCATNLALRNPNIYMTFASYSGYANPTYQSDDKGQTIASLFGGSRHSYDANDPLFLIQHGHYNGMAGWYEVGAQDSEALSDIKTLLPLSVKAGIETCSAEPSGGHDFTFWSQAFRDSLPWLSWRLKLTPRPASMVAHCTMGAS